MATYKIKLRELPPTA
jgi:hypothetical protein